MIRDTGFTTFQPNKALIVAAAFVDAAIRSIRDMSETALCKSEDRAEQGKRAERVFTEGVACNEKLHNLRQIAQDAIDYLHIDKTIQDAYGGKPDASKNPSIN